MCGCLSYVYSVASDALTPHLADVPSSLLKRICHVEIEIEPSSRRLAHGAAAMSEGAVPSTALLRSVEGTCLLWNSDGTCDEATASATSSSRTVSETAEDVAGSEVAISTPSSEVAISTSSSEVAISTSSSEVAISTPSSPHAGLPPLKLPPSPGHSPDREGSRGSSARGSARALLGSQKPILGSPSPQKPILGSSIVKSSASPSPRPKPKPKPREIAISREKEIAISREKEMAISREKEMQLVEALHANLPVEPVVSCATGAVLSANVSMGTSPPLPPPPPPPPPKVEIDRDAPRLLEVSFGEGRLGLEIDRDAPRLLEVSFGEGRLGLGLSDAPGSGGGVVVSEVAAGSAAALAGVLVGSWCLSLNALDVSDLDCRELSRQIGSSARPLHMTLALPRSAHDGAGAHDGGEGAHYGASAHNGGGAGAHDGAIEPCLDGEVLGEVHTGRLGAFDLLGEMQCHAMIGAVSEHCARLVLDRPDRHLDRPDRHLDRPDRQLDRPDRQLDVSNAQWLAMEMELEAADTIEALETTRRALVRERRERSAQLGAHVALLVRQADLVVRDRAVHLRSVNASVNAQRDADEARARSPNTAPSPNTAAAKSTAAAVPPTPSSAAVGTEANGTTRAPATTHPPATTRAPATTLATCRALEGLSAQLGATEAEERAVGDLGARLRLVLEALQAQVAGQKARARVL